MARIRSIKPDFFQNTDLAELSTGTRLLFIGLWTLSDREGRLIDNPKKIKAAVFPYETFNTEKGLKDLDGKGFIQRYTSNKGDKLIQIITFLKHQKPHIKEAPSTYPAPTQAQPKPVLAGQEGKGMVNGEWLIGNDNGDSPTPTQEGDKPQPEKKENFSAPKILTPIGHYEISECLENYFTSPSLSMTRDQLCMTNHFDVEILRDWGDAFNRSLIDGGIATKTPEDYNRHFSNWLKLQNKNENPKTLFTDATPTPKDKPGVKSRGNVQGVFNAIDSMPD